jgi:glycyl-tRNA synthetase
VERERDPGALGRDDRGRHPGSLFGLVSTDAVTMDKIVALARRRGFVFPASEIYGGLGSSYDYGHYGVLLKDNVRARWLDAMVRERDDIVALDSSIILNPRVWEASGHVGGFSDPLVDCRTCKQRFRADKLDEAQCGRKPSKHPGETPDCDLTEPRQFNLMFRTRVGAVEETGVDVYLRPETAQGIFINFKNVAQIARRKPPFGIAQVGKSFRNEITPGNFIFRTLEFEQMEMEYFVPPDEAAEWFRYWVEQRLAWHVRYGVRESHLRVRAHEADELSHYSTETSDIEYLYPIGWSELEGVANRGAYDLTQHTEASGTKLEWVDAGTGERFVPHVIEPALGLNRSLLTFLIDAYDEEVVGERERTVLRLHPQLAPVTAAVLPLIAKDTGMVEKARALYEELRRHFSVEYDDSGAIGRRYRRQDEIGTPYGITIDEQTLEDETVTLRDRDSLEQERIPIGGVRGRVAELLASDWRSPKAA